MSMRIEVVYALPHEQECVSLDLPAGSTVREAVEASGLLERLPQAELGAVGVWGRQVAAETRLHERDRVEIYRPLIASPGEIRRARAAKSRK